MSPIRWRLVALLFLAVVALGIGGTGIQSSVARLFPTGTSCTQTGDGEPCWDSDDDALTVGTGASRKTLLDTTGASAGYQPLDSDLTTWAGLTPSAYFQTLVDDSSASVARSTLGTVIGTDVQAHDADLDTIAGYTIDSIPVLSGESYTTVLIPGRRYNLLTADIADLITNPPTGWAWRNSVNTMSSALIASGSLTINADTSHSYNTTGANPVLYHRGVTSSATLTVHCRSSGNESFEGGFVYVSESAGVTDGVRIGPVGSDCDLEAYDSASVKPLAMACDDWWWARVTVNATTVSWWMQSNGSTDSPEPTAIGSDYTSTWVYGGQTTLSTREGAYQTEIGIGILRTGAVSGAFRLNCNTVRLTIPGEF